MISSTVYHLFNSLSREHYEWLLKVDLVGIGFKIAGLAVSLIYTGFHNYRGAGLPMVIVLGIAMSSNLILQMTPCYMHDRFSRFRLLFYVLLIISLLGVAIMWTFFIASSIELGMFLIRLTLSFLYLGVGFFFWKSGYPERVTSNYWV